MIDTTQLNMVEIAQLINRHPQRDVIVQVIASGMKNHQPDFDEQAFINLAVQDYYGDLKEELQIGQTYLTKGGDKIKITYPEDSICPSRWAHSDFCYFGTNETGDWFSFRKFGKVGQSWPKSNDLIAVVS